LESGAEAGDVEEYFEEEGGIRKGRRIRGRGGRRGRRRGGG